MKHRVYRLPLALVALSLGLACGESREEKLRRELGYAAEKTARKPIEGQEIPPHPVREALRPVLSKIYSHPELPGVLEEDVFAEDPRYPYALQAGVLAVVRVPPGASTADKARGILLATAEADAWVFRENARMDYAKLIEKVKYGFGDDQKVKILRGYADLKLMHFFNSSEAAAAIAELPADVRPTVEAMRDDYVKNRDKYWEEWMGVKMYARRRVAGDEPFRGLLRQIGKEMGRGELPPRPFLASVPEPLKGWAREIEANEELLIKLTNLRELRERVDFLGDTHTLWVIEGSEEVPEKARGLKPNKELGYAFLREDLGGGYNELTFVLGKGLSGAALKRAFLHTLIFRQLLSDFQMLATAGGDFSERNPDGSVVKDSSVVPDEYDPLFATCGATGALDSLVVGYSSTIPTLSGLTAKSKTPELTLKVAHKCVIDGAKGRIYIPRKDDEFDSEGPAPASRLALYQMLARFEKIDVDLSGLGDGAKKTEEDAAVEDAEALLKQIKSKK